MRVIPERKSSLPIVNRVLTPASPEFSTYAAHVAALGSGGSTTYISASDPVAYPFAISEALLVKKLGWCNGSAAGGGVDVGIYTPAWARLVSTGAQTASGTVAWQWIDVADTTIPPGRYYLVICRDNITANRASRVCNSMGAAAMLSLMGVKDSATDAYPLPDPLTNMADAATFTVIYAIGIQAQAVAGF